MSFVHYVSVGDFEKDDRGDFLLKKSPVLLMPVVRRPFDAEIVTWLNEIILDDWHLGFEGDCLIFDFHHLGLEEFAVLRKLVDLTGCQLLYNGYQEISVNSLSPNLRILQERGSSSSPANLSCVTSAELLRRLAT